MKQGSADRYDLFDANYLLARTALITILRVCVRVSRVCYLVAGLRRERGSTSRRSRRGRGAGDGWGWNRGLQRVEGQGDGAIKAAVDVLEVVGGGEAREGTPSSGWRLLAGVV